MCTKTNFVFCGICTKAVEIFKSLLLRLICVFHLPSLCVVYLPSRPTPSAPLCGIYQMCGNGGGVRACEAERGLVPRGCGGRQSCPTPYAQRPSQGLHCPCKRCARERDHSHFPSKPASSIFHSVKGLLHSL